MKSYEILPAGMTRNAKGPKPYEILPGDTVATPEPAGRSTGLHARVPWAEPSPHEYRHVGGAGFGDASAMNGSRPDAFPSEGSTLLVGRQPKPYEIMPLPGLARRGLEKPEGRAGKCQGDRECGGRLGDFTSFADRAPSPLDVIPRMSVCEFRPGGSPNIEVQRGAHDHLPGPIDDAAARMFACQMLRGRRDYLLQRLTEIQDTQRQISDELDRLRTMNPVALHAAACQAILDQAGDLSIIINRAIDDGDSRTVAQLQLVHRGLLDRAQACVNEPYSVSGPEATGLATERVRRLRRMQDTQQFLLINTITELADIINQFGILHC